MPHIYIYNHIHISIIIYNILYTYHAPVYSVSEACKNWCGCNVQSSSHTKCINSTAVITMRNKRGCKHCNYPPWIRLVTTMGFMFLGRIVAKKEISYRNAANTFHLIALPSHYSQWLESCKHANTSCLERLTKYVIDSEYDIECLETCSIWYHIIIIMSWWRTILPTRLPILIPVTSSWCTKGTQDPLSFPTSPARPDKNPKSSRSKNCFWGTFHLPKVHQAMGLSSKGKNKV